MSISDDDDFIMDEGAGPAVSSKTSNPKKGSASEQYQKLSQLEHILKRPDTYIGSVEKYASEQWIYNEETQCMEKKMVSIVPGLFKIFDEILVNAADNKIRDPSMKRIDVRIDAEQNVIAVKNDGKGIPVEIHSKEKMYIPELIFGNLLTSSNYDDDQKKVTGGRNGYGAKLCNIFSTEFTVHTADKSNKKEYIQIWRNNMSDVGKPKISAFKKQSEFTEIIFKPDLAKFGMTRLDNEILGVLKRRVYDISGSVRGVKVTLNGELLKIANFKQYVELYVKAIEKAKEDHPPEQIKVGGDEESSENKDSNDSSAPFIPEKMPTIVHQVINDRWEVAFSMSDGTFNQVSFVNSIATTSGGTHVDMVANSLVSKIMDQIKKKNKKAIIKPFQIKTNMFLFINCLIENPAFTSQTKEQLTTRPSQFGGKKLELPEAFVKKVLNCGILDQVLDIVSANADKALKKNDGSRKNRITNYPKLEDANKAGTKDGHKCTLILTEGDSAKSLAVQGLAVVGRDFYGCFPLRGKMLNVREASADQIMKNAEIEAIKQIVGLQHKKNYSLQNINTLRYGRIMIMADQDHDGSHIKGLIINFLEISFPGLLEIPNFLIEFITPIVKVTILSGRNKNTVIPFFSMPEYEAWRDSEGKSCSYRQKYYKGLGTSEAHEMREYFSQLDKHLKNFNALREQDKLCIDLAFSKKKADDRKEWLREFQPGTFLDSTITHIPISDFINKELILFSMADNVRSIPSVMDGLKPSQRKILYGCYKRKMKGQLKVSQLVGYISEHTAYHHGEASLMQSIISLAQNFVGSNNLNILVPRGGFGSRASGGKDAAAARYIFTELTPITKIVFNTLDSPLLKYLQDDEQTVEPEWYVPILPMLLVNGSEGIGSGWSTNIPSFNPIDIVENLRALMAGEEMKEMIPWFKGWEGRIKKISEDRYRIEGLIEDLGDNTLAISELPIKMWTITMKEYLLQGLAGSEKQKSWIKDMEEDHGIGIRFIVKLSNEEMAKTRKIGLLERFKLVSSISTSNMVAFDPRGRIKKYSKVNDILEDYYHVRLEYYQKRKDYTVTEYSNQLEKLSSQAKFVKMIIDKELIVTNKKRTDLISELNTLGFPGFDKDNEPIRTILDPTLIKKELESDDDNEEVEDPTEIEAAATTTDNTGLIVNNKSNLTSIYDYLLGMQIWSLTRERYERLLKMRGEKEALLNTLLNKSAKDLWNEDLEEFLIAWESFLKEDEAAKSSMIANAPSKKSAKRRRKPLASKTNVKKEEDTKPKAKKPRVDKPKTVKTEEVKNELLDLTDLTDFEKASKEFNKSSAEFGKSVEKSASTTPLSSSTTESFSSSSTKNSATAKHSTRKNIIIESSDDDDDSIALLSDHHENDSENDDDEDESVTVQARTRPSRAKKVTKTYALDSEDNEDSDDDESDDLYSDFE